MYDIFDYLAPVVYRRCVAGADVSGLVRCDLMWSDAVINHNASAVPCMVMLRI